MRIRLGNGLIIANVLSWLLTLAVFTVQSHVIRVIVAIPFLLFFPGYAMIAAIFVRKDSLGGIARVALSFGMSIAIVPLLGLMLNGTPWGIRALPVCLTVSGFIFIASAVALLRLSALDPAERFGVELGLGAPVPGRGTRDGVLTAVMIIAGIAVLATLGYVVAKPKPGEMFTEFRIVGREPTGDYPGILKAGEQGRVVIGIANREGKEVSYRVAVVTSGQKTSEISPVVLTPGQEWQQEVTFEFPATGARQKVEFLLYRDGGGAPYLGPLYLWVNVD